MADRARVTADDLGINVGSRRERALFHWLICVILFSKPVQQEIAAAAFRALKENKADTPERIRAAGWQRLVKLLGEAHYKRYDESTASRLIAASRKVEEEYGGKLRNLVTACDDEAALRKAIQGFKGIGPKGAEIFIGEVAPAYFR
jgi:endonuclease III